MPLTIAEKNKILAKLINRFKIPTTVDDILRADLYFIFIFDHKFVREIWGDKLLCYDCGEPVGKPFTIHSAPVQIGTGTCDCSRQFENNDPAYIWHLKQMISCEEPLCYLQDFLEDPNEKIITNNFIGPNGGVKHPC